MGPPPEGMADSEAHMHDAGMHHDPAMGPPPGETGPLPEDMPPGEMPPPGPEDDASGGGEGA